MLLRFRQFFNRTLTAGPAMFRRLGIEMSDIDCAQKGLIIIQIDGLSANRLQRAIKRRHMPFLKRLLRKRRVKMHRYLSEVPTSTPAFQGGMFYGDNDNIPGFNFYDKKEKQFYRMGDSESAFRVESSFSKPGLLRRGSVFSCVYSGGAESSLFIFSSLLAPQRWRFALRIYDLIVLTLIHLIVVIRIIALAVIEFVVGLADLIKRVISNGRVFKELEMLAIRIGLTVISRELITLGSVIDVYRRVPVIYVNYLGYDEYGHLRGPNSRFAMWSLRAIDRCIGNIYRASQYSEREYDVYILSDHGQCACKPFQVQAGESLAEFLQDQLRDLAVEHESRLDEKTSQLLLSWQGTNRLAQNMPWYLRYPVQRYSAYLKKKFFEARARTEPWEDVFDLTVFSTGPIAYAYWSNSQEKEKAESIERQHPGLLNSLARHSCIGFISVVRQDGLVLAMADGQEAIISERGLESKSGPMPFDASSHVDHALRGIWRITTFSRSGDICIWGGNSRSGDISFSDEVGAHSGWTDEEVESFVLAPSRNRFDFSQIRTHAEFYDYFSAHYGPWHPKTSPDADAVPHAGAEEQLRPKD